MTEKSCILLELRQELPQQLGSGTNSASSDGHNQSNMYRKDLT